MRYSRHLKLFSKCSKSIENAKILVCGSGGLGSNVLQLLSRIKVKEIHIYDDGIVDKPDLNRQVLYDTKDLNKSKVLTAVKKLKDINPEIDYYAHNERITKDTVFPKVDVVIDCLDNFESRKILDEKVEKIGVPLIHGGVEEFFGQVTVVIPKKTKSLREIFEGIKDSKKTKLVTPYIVSTIASIQVSETLKILCGDYENALINKMLIVDLFFNSFDTIDLK